MEADFQRYYGLDLEGMYRGEMDPLRVARLTSKLPPEGATGKALGSDGFGTAEYLLLSVLDLLMQGNWLQANKGVKKSQQSPPPKPLPRPGAIKKVPVVTVAKLLAFAERSRKRKP